MSNMSHASAKAPHGILFWKNCVFFIVANLSSCFLTPDLLPLSHRFFQEIQQKDGNSFVQTM